MNSTPAFLHRTIKHHEFHHRIHHKWLPSPDISPYYGPTQQEKPHGIPQEYLQKCCIFPLQHRRGKPRLTCNCHQSTIYLVQTGHDIIAPINQLNYPNILSYATEQQIKMIERNHKEERLIFEELLYARKYLKHQLINTIKPIYMALIKNE